jgi:hypothetical protein
MHFSRPQVILALLPFGVTLITLGVFLLFFYQNTVTFSSPTPFEITYHDHRYPSVDNQVSLTASAGEQTFVASQPSYESQTFTLNVPWYKPTKKPIGLRFVPQSSQLKDFVIPPLGIASTISDTVTILSQSGSTLPDLTPYSRAVISLQGEEACLFSTNGSKVIHWQASDGQLQVLPEGTVECAIRGDQVVPVIYNDGHIQIGDLKVAITLPDQWQLITSPYEETALVISTDTNDRKKIQLLTKDGANTIGSFATVAPQARFINNSLWALTTKDATLIFNNDQQISQLSSLIPVQSILTTANPLNDGFDMYYITKQKDLSLDQLLQNTPPQTQLIRMDSRTQETTVIFTLPTDTTVSGSRIDTSAPPTLLYSVLTPTPQLLRVQIGPEL